MSSLNISVSDENSQLKVYAQSKYYDYQTTKKPNDHKIFFHEKVNLESRKNLRSLNITDELGENKISEKRAKELGNILFDVIFSGEILSLYRFHLFDNPRNTLRLDFSKAPKLNNLPWELLFDQERDMFLGLSNKFSIVRYLPLTLVRRRAASSKISLKILFVISNEAELKTEEEWYRVNNVLEGSISQNLVTLEKLESLNVKNLQTKINKFKPNIIHFIGHSNYDMESQEGSVKLTNSKGSVEKISPEELGHLLGDSKDLLLLVLNSCQSSLTSPQLVYSGICQKIMQAGAPAVISMQREISDNSAITFSERFYLSLLTSMPVEFALTEARKSLWSVNKSEVDWFIPTLYSRSEENILFEFPKIYSFKEAYSKNRTKFNLLFFNLTIILMASSHLLVNFFYKTTNITVYNSDHKPVSNATIRISTLDYTGYTDDHGSINIPLFNRQGELDFYIYKEGYTSLKSKLVPGTKVHERIHKEK